MARRHVRVHGRRAAHHPGRPHRPPAPPAPRRCGVRRRLRGRRNGHQRWRADCRPRGRWTRHTAGRPRCGGGDKRGEVLIDAGDLAVGLGDERPSERAQGELGGLGRTRAGGRDRGAGASTASSCASSCARRDARAARRAPGTIISVSWFSARCPPSSRYRGPGAADGWSLSRPGCRGDLEARMICPGESRGLIDARPEEVPRRAA